MKNQRGLVSNTIFEKLPRGLAAIAVGLFLCLFPAGCSMFKLSKDLEVLYSELAIVSGDVRVVPSLRGQPIVLLTQGGDANANGETPRLVDYRIADGQQRYNFQAREGQYRLMAFLDQNADFIYQPGEPAVIQSSNAVTNRLDTRRMNWRFNRLEIEQGATRTRLPIAADLSDDGLQELERTATTMGVPIDFNNFRFREANISLGMWEPSRWFLEVSYGFYLLEPWDPNEVKPLLLLIHGINGSPRDFRGLLERLDTSEMRVALFHYPSGMSIEDNAYMLSQIMNELLIRNPDQKYVLLAHSMGGLLSKRFIQMQEAAGHSHSIDKFISISTPWAGHRAAAAGAEYSPVVAPVWEDMAPKSAFIRELMDYSLPDDVDYTMFFSHGGNNVMHVESNDGAVSLDSQLDPSMQDRANALIGVSQDHMGILSDPRTVAALDRVLAAR